MRSTLFILFTMASMVIMVNKVVVVIVLVLMIIIVRFYYGLFETRPVNTSSKNFCVTVLIFLVIMAIMVIKLLWLL